MERLAFSLYSIPRWGNAGLRLIASSRALAAVELFESMPPVSSPSKRGDPLVRISREGPDPAGALRRAEDELAEYIAGDRREFDVPLDLDLGQRLGGRKGADDFEIAPRLPATRSRSELQPRVWRALCEIPFGELRTYGQIAESLGLGRQAARAVGQAVGRNPFAIIVPCHRVIGKDGRLTGFSCGLSLKLRLLTLEGWRVDADGRDALARSRVSPSTLALPA